MELLRAYKEGRGGGIIAKAEGGKLYNVLLTYPPLLPESPDHGIHHLFTMISIGIRRGYYGHEIHHT